jgi:hypothetical protein
MRILVCGGRDFDDYAMVCAALNAAHKKHFVQFIIHGAARGADSLADRWAAENGIHVRAFPANWKQDGKSAGPLRNQRMLDEGKPNAVVAFPGGRGTADMIARAKAAGVPVWEIT